MQHLCINASVCIRVCVCSCKWVDNVIVLILVYGGSSKVTGQRRGRESAAHNGTCRVQASAARLHAGCIPQCCLKAEVRDHLGNDIELETVSAPCLARV